MIVALGLSNYFGEIGDGLATFLDYLMTIHHDALKIDLNI
jgi:hypothetical protein